MVSWPDAEVWALLGLIVGAMVLGGVVGLDRELANRSAGLRTHMLVAGAAAVFVMLGEILLRGYDRGIEPDILRSDPLRLIGAVITGVSFLGAGTIIKKTGADQGDGVEGLTTAASLLMSAAIGMTIALRQFWLAIGVVGITLATLRLLRWLQEWAGWRC
ncbi:MAG: hypothetical protein Nkreftii_002162 [Candidatus Nitrospira kreftii]|uniref:MgtC/SapB/SrpB/YhiD N-terminal domain-containing protein n=1 Tax=Candidatus Nitrospira kreftii TaxID=2652173 RepID=A0A7S8FEJ7_9BACT|nr:MAG: hypothetical protein Nkreftii_002162 [Candidatus Nitrospira kreftii]